MSLGADGRAVISRHLDSWWLLARLPRCRCCERISCTTPIKVTEARAHGADCSDHHGGLDDAAARDIEDASPGHGMDVLIEVMNGAELDRALKLRSSRQQPQLTDLRPRCNQRKRWPR